MAREPFNRTWNETPDAPDQYREPTNEVWEDGWRGGATEEPPKAWFQNWWQRRLDQALQALERLGALTWNEEAEYRIGALAIGSNGTKYISTTGTESVPNVGNDPVTDGGTNWSVYYEDGAPGDVKMVATSAPPPGWLKANGANVSRTQYARLFSAIGTTYGNGDGSTTFALPDLRGQFVRGWDDGKGVDDGRSFGSIQSDAFKSHNHSGSTSNDTHNHSGSTSNDTHSHSGSTSSDTHSHGTDWPTSDEGEDRNQITAGGNGVSNGSFDRNTNSDTHNHTFTTSNDTHNHTFTTSNDTHNHTFTTNTTGGNETRPTNVALLYCIKF